MNLDLVTVQLMAALVVNVSGIVFILETLIRRDEGAGRVWALAFLAGMLTTIAYLVWTMDAGAWWAVAAGNASFVAATGCMWLGCRSFNMRRMAVAGLIVLVGSGAVFGATLAEGPAGGDWAGALWMFAGLLAFSILGSVEALRGEMGSIRSAWALAVVLALEALFYLLRIVVFVAAGPDSAIFQTWLGTPAAAVLTVTLTIVALVVTSVLRAGRAQLRGYERVAELGVGGDGVLPYASFLRVLRDVAERAQWRGDLVGAIAVRVEDLDQISTAFGSEVARSVTESWRAGVRRYAPPNAVVGEDGATGLLLVIVAVSPADARRQAATIYRGLFEDLGAVTGGVIPVVGVGVGLSDSTGYDAAALVRVARDAAQRAATTVESSVLVGEAD